MVDYIEIINTLNKLDSEYSASSDLQMTILYSKLSVIELCGWIEVSIDEILTNYIDSHIIDVSLVNDIKRIIKRNYGFKYDNNIFPLLCSVLGINNVENMLDSIPLAQFVQFKCIVENYSVVRNIAAHTDTPLGTTRTFYAPSQVIGDYAKIKPFVTSIEDYIKAL